MSAAGTAEGRTGNASGIETTYAGFRAVRAACRISVNGFGRPRITGQKTAEKKARGKPGRVDRAPPFVYTDGIRMLREARS